MPIFQQQAKRKVSCMPCRLKKIKCNGEQPCTRCIQRQCIDGCVYKNPGPVGRPPKNAVVNKLVLSRQTKASFCNEFIFEHTPLINDAKYLCIAKGLGLEHYINNIFCEYFQIGISLRTSAFARSKIESSRWVAQLKIYDLVEYFPWVSADFVNVLLQRISRLPLEHHIGLDFTSNGLARDHSVQFFSLDKTNRALTLNPLNSLPPQQALRLFDMFFDIDPFSFILSKAKILNKYWADTEDPLLLSVIFGTTVFKSRMFEGKPLGLWRATSSATRNHFFDYAEVLLSQASAEITLSKYQAVVLLALFEVSYGYAKRGLSLFALSYMFAKRLLHGDPSLSTQIPLDSVEREMLLYTFWSSKNCTVRGALEYGRIPRSALVYHSTPFPPVNVASSLVYQYDEARGYSRTKSGTQYFVETFYCNVVIIRFSSQLIMWLPDSMDGSQPSSPALNPADTMAKITSGLNDFDQFIEKNRWQWSTLQHFIIRTTWRLYKIYFTFLKPGSTRDRPLGREDKSSKLPSATDDIIESNTDDIQQLDQLIPIVTDMIYDTDQLLSTATAPGAQDSDFKPRGIILSALEASARLLILKCKRDPWDDESHRSLETISKLTEGKVWDDWTAVKVVKDILHSFFRCHKESALTDGSDISLTTASNTPLTSDISWLDTNFLDFDTLFWNSNCVYPETLSTTEFTTIAAGGVEFFQPDKYTTLQIQGPADCPDPCPSQQLELEPLLPSHLTDISFDAANDPFSFLATETLHDPDQQQALVDQILMGNTLSEPSTE